MRIPVVSYDGLRVLNNLANEHQPWFLSADSDRIKHEVELRCPGTGFDRDVDLGLSLDELSRFASRGPEKDGEHAPVVREALGGLTLVDATDARLWASVSCFALGAYVPTRWESATLKTRAERTSWIARHWLARKIRGVFRFRYRHKSPRVVQVQCQQPLAPPRRPLRDDRHCTTDCSVPGSV